MNEPLVLEDWELVYLKDSVSSSIARFSELLKEAEKSGIGLDSIETVIKNYKGLQRKLDAAAVGKD
jgi:hypothetical protein